MNLIPLNWGWKKYFYSGEWGWNGRNVFDVEFVGFCNALGGDWGCSWSFVHVVDGIASVIVGSNLANYFASIYIWMLNECKEFVFCLCVAFV